MSRERSRHRPARRCSSLLVATLALGVTTLSLLQTLVMPVLGTIAEQLRVSPGAAGCLLVAVDAGRPRAHGPRGPACAEP